MINICRQVVTLWDIAIANGQAIDPAIQSGALSLLSSSTTKWLLVNQGRPDKKNMVRGLEVLLAHGVLWAIGFILPINYDIQLLLPPLSAIMHDNNVLEIQSPISIQAIDIH